MKLTNTQHVYVRSMSKLLRVTAMFDNDADANAYMASHKDDAVIAVMGDFVFLANVYDKGAKIAA